MAGGWLIPPPSPHPTHRYWKLQGSLPEGGGGVACQECLGGEGEKGREEEGGGEGYREKD
jgi:hypothetical protein